MTKTTKTSTFQMPQRWDLDDSYMEPIEDGDYVKTDDVRPLVAEINRLRAENERLSAENERLSARVKVLETELEKAVKVGWEVVALAGQIDNHMVTLRSIRHTLKD